MTSDVLQRFCDAVSRNGSAALGSAWNRIATVANRGVRSGKAKAKSSSVEQRNGSAKSCTVVVLHLHATYRVGSALYSNGKVANCELMFRSGIACSCCVKQW